MMDIGTLNVDIPICSFLDALKRMTTSSARIVESQSKRKNENKGTYS
jgi:hypothetical protein